MRAQRRAPLTVQLVHVTTTRDELGDGASTTTVTTIEGATFEPARTLERTEPDQAPVVQPAVFNLPGVHDVDADDEIRIGTGVAVAVWRVLGGGDVWLDRTKVPVTQTRST